MKYLLIAFFPVFAMANTLALPDNTTSLTLNLQATVSPCNYKGMKSSVSETAKEILIDIEVVDYTKKGCDPETSVASEQISVELSAKQAQSNKNIIIQSNNESLRVRGVNFN